MCFLVFCSLNAYLQSSYLKSCNPQVRDFWQQEFRWLGCSEKIICGVSLVLSLRKVDQNGCNSHLIWTGWGGREIYPSQAPTALLRSGDRDCNRTNPLSLYDLFVHSLRSLVDIFQCLDMMWVWGEETDSPSLHLVRKQSVTKQALKMISEYDQCHGAFSK